MVASERGQIVPETVRSTQPNVNITFQSNVDGTGIGFEIEIQFFLPGKNNFN